MAQGNLGFIEESTNHNGSKEKQDLSLCIAYPIIDSKEENSVLTKSNKSPRELYKEIIFTEDGLYAPQSPFTYNTIKPYHLKSIKMLEYDSKTKFSGKLLEIAIREVTVHTVDADSNLPIEICSVSILFKKKTICKTNKPFNRKLYKLLIRHAECNNLFMQVHTQSGRSSAMPLPLPKHDVRDHKVDINFAINDTNGIIHDGTVTYTISLSNHGTDHQPEHRAYLYKLNNDPNDPQNSLSLFRPQKSIRKEHVKHFLLEQPALTLCTDSKEMPISKKQEEDFKLPDMVVTEQAAFSLFDVSFRNLFQVRRPLQPSSSTLRHHSIGKTVLTITLLRGVEVPVREESALVQPLVEVEWGNTTQTTSIADGPAPVWQQTMHFELPRQNDDYCVRIRLFDQHPVWGQQWLGEARVPLEYHRSYQELERWIALSPLFSPVQLFGYVQASPGQSHTRIYVLIKMEQPGNPKAIDTNSMNTLLKGIQRCQTIPYKISSLKDPEDAGKLAMLLPELPIHYGPIMPHQALKLKKIDHYGRAALLATLLQGFDLEAYVLLGSSQISKRSAFVLCIGENENHTLWDPEIGKHWNLGDSHCPLIKVSRLVNHAGIWENLQKSILPHNLKYNVKINKDWRPVDSIVSSANTRTLQTLELSITDEEVKWTKKTATETEQYLKDKLAEWRSEVSLTTIFNRHAISVLRNFISKVNTSPKRQLDKQNLKQLHRAYHMHGFVLNTRLSTASELSEQLHTTKVHDITGPVEFALVCQIEHFVGKICSIWLAVVILRSRD